MTQVKSNFEIAMAICKRYMANYTETTTAPKQIKGGFFAIVNGDTGDVWFNEVSSFTNTLSRFRSGRDKQLARPIEEARRAGVKLHLWFLTRPDVYSAQQLENELYEANLLLERKKPIRNGPGELLVIRHRTSKDYYLQVNRSEPEPSVILGKFLERLRSTKGMGHNVKLDKFITEHADDIMRGMNFDITHVCNVKDNDEVWLQRQIFVEEQIYGECLNYHDME